MLGLESAQLQKQKKINIKKEMNSSPGVHLLSFGSDKNMLQSMNCPELSTDVEDSRAVCILSMRYACAQLTDRTKKVCVCVLGEGCGEERKNCLCSQEIFCHG